MPLQAERREGEGELSQFSLSGNWGNVPFKICQDTEGNMYQYMKNYPLKNIFLDWKMEPQTAFVLNQSLLTAAKLFRINAVFTSVAVVGFHVIEQVDVEGAT